MRTSASIVVVVQIAAIGYLVLPTLRLEQRGAAIQVLTIILESPKTALAIRHGQSTPGRLHNFYP
jgi:hypothetical protein